MDACNAGLPCSIFQTNVNIFAMRSIFRVPKMLLLAIYDEVIQYQMESKNMYSVLYQIRSEMFASLSIHFNLQCTDPRCSDIRHQKRHNAQWHDGPVRLTARVIAYLNEHCSRPQPSLWGSQMFRFPIGPPSQGGMLFCPRARHLKVNKLRRKMKH